MFLIFQFDFLVAKLIIFVLNIYYYVQPHAHNMIIVPQYEL